MIYTQAHVRTRVGAGTRFCESRPADQQTWPLDTGRGDLSVTMTPTEDGVRQMDGYSHWTPEVFLPSESSSSRHL